MFFNIDFISEKVGNLWRQKYLEFGEMFNSLLCERNA